MEQIGKEIRTGTIPGLERPVSRLFFGTAIPPVLTGEPGAEELLDEESAGRHRRSYSFRESDEYDDPDEYDFGDYRGGRSASGGLQNSSLFNFGKNPGFGKDISQLPGLRGSAPGRPGSLPSTAGAGRADAEGTGGGGRRIPSGDQRDRDRQIRSVPVAGIRSGAAFRDPDRRTV